MADYSPLIARAISGLDPSAPGESRRALYERARAALIAQLRGVQPPLSESEITRERLALEEAVRKVESEAAQRARDASRASSGAARAGDALRRANNGRRGEAAPAAAAQANRAARKTYANVPAPSPEFDRLEPNLEDGGGEAEAPYSYDEPADEAERYAPPPLPPRSRVGAERERQPKRSRSATVFPFKSAIAVGIVLILVG